MNVPLPLRNHHSFRHRPLSRHLLLPLPPLSQFPELTAMADESTNPRPSGEYLSKTADHPEYRGSGKFYYEFERLKDSPYQFWLPIFEDNRDERISVSLSFLPSSSSSSFRTSHLFRLEDNAYPATFRDNHWYVHIPETELPALINQSPPQFDDLLFGIKFELISQYLDSWTFRIVYPSHWKAEINHVTFYVIPEQLELPFES